MVKAQFITDTTKSLFTYTKSDGSFDLAVSNQGVYLISVKSLGFDIYIDTLYINGRETFIRLKDIFLEPSPIQLKAIDVKTPKPSISIKKDTLEMVADSFPTRSHALLEDLLNKLPGIQVQQDGTITYFGEKVSAIWVDGSPFFGENTTVTSKNLSADMIERLQIIERKRDNGNAGGLSNNKKENIINLVIKKNKKENWIGQLMAGTSEDGKYASQGMASKFSQSGQIALVGEIDNINGYQQTRPSAGDNGFRKTEKSGINFSDLLQNNWSLSTSIMLDRTRNENENIKTGKYILHDSIMPFAQKDKNQEQNDLYRFNIRLERTNDTTQSLIVDLAVSYTSKYGSALTDYRSLTSDGTLLSNSNINNRSNNQSWFGSYTINYTRKLQRPGRSYSLSLNGSHTTDNYKLYNITNNFLSSPGDSLENVRTNQLLQRSKPEQGVSFIASWTEPLSKNQSLDFLCYYGTTDAKSAIIVNGFDKVSGIYNIFIDSLSNNLTLLTNVIETGPKWRFHDNKWDLGMSLTYYNANLRYLNNTRSGKSKQQYTSINKTISLSHYVKKDLKLQLNYYNVILLPQVSDLQPLTNNTNPLLITIGNPELKNSYTHDISLTLQKVNISNGSLFSTGIQGLITQNKISVSISYDSLGRQISQPVNLNGQYNLYGYLSKHFTLSKQLYIESTGRLYTSRLPSLVQNIKKYTSFNGAGSNINLGYNRNKWLDLIVRAEVNYTVVNYNNGHQPQTKYFRNKFGGEINLELPMGIAIGTNADYIMNTGLSGDFNQNICMLNAYAGKTLLKNKGLLKLQGFDILRQNLSVTRSVSASYLEDTRSSVLQRFFLLSFTWFFGPTEKSTE